MTRYTDKELKALAVSTLRQKAKDHDVIMKYVGYTLLIDGPVNGYNQVTLQVGYNFQDKATGIRSNFVDKLNIAI